MKQLTEEQLLSNWNKLLQLVEDTFEGDRKEKLLEMYKYFEDRMSVAPASGKAAYHNAMVGGYVEHVLHVTDCAIQIKKLWESNGAMINFTDEELIFAAMHHDLGKVGDLNQDYYIPQDSEWHRKNRGEIFKHNPNLQYMTVTDRAIFLLNHFGTASRLRKPGGLTSKGISAETTRSHSGPQLTVSMTSSALRMQDESPISKRPQNETSKSPRMPSLAKAAAI